MRSGFFILLSVLLIFQVTPSVADFSGSEAWFGSLSQDDRTVVQTNLVLTGAYDRLIDGEFGVGTYRALVHFQDTHHFAADGVLTTAQRQRLQDEASAIYGRLGFDAVEDADGGVGVFLPANLLDNRTEVTNGTTYFSVDGKIQLQTRKRLLSEASFAEQFEGLLKPQAARRVVYKHYDATSMTVSGHEGSGSFYARYYNDGTASVGYELSWAPKYRTVGTMLSILLASFSYPLAANAAPTEGSLALAGAAAEPQYFAGSGFFFADGGMIATNYHVAGECSKIDVTGFGPATLIRGDAQIDLAAIQLDSRLSPHWATIRSTPPELAEEVLLMGFPLADILNSSLNVATGIVSSETGLGGDQTSFTTNAGIQPGNSGGPLLDDEGNVIGMAVAKIDDTKLLADFGTTAPNVGFGIKNTAILRFLSIFQHVEASPGSRAVTPKEVSKIGKEFTVQIICEAAPGAGAN